MDSLSDEAILPQSAGVLREVPPSQWGPEHRLRLVNYPVLEEPEHVECRIVSFGAGGFEMTVRVVDLQARIDRQMSTAPLRGHRKPIDQRCEVDKARSVRRARQKVRGLCRQIGAQYLMTLTTRESENSPEELALRWKRFCRIVHRRLGYKLVSVVVPERHPSNPNHWHLHAALPAFLNVNVARPIWWACCGGRGMGNIDMKYIKVPHAMGPGERSRRVARYLSKYMTKELMTEHRPDKKNYWRSRFDDPDVRRCILEARPGEWSRIVDECVRRFGVVWNVDDQRDFFFFPDASGFWYSHAAGGFGQPPPPF